MNITTDVPKKVQGINCKHGHSQMEETWI